MNTDQGNFNEKVKNTTPFNLFQCLASVGTNHKKNYIKS